MARTDDPNPADQDRERTGKSPDRTSVLMRDHLQNQHHPLSPVRDAERPRVKPGESSHPAGASLPNLPALTLTDYIVISILLALAAIGIWVMLYLCDYIIAAYPK